MGAAALQIVLADSIVGDVQVAATHDLDLVALDVQATDELGNRDQSPATGRSGSPSTEVRSTASGLNREGPTRARAACYTDTS